LEEETIHRLPRFFVALYVATVSIPNTEKLFKKQTIAVLAGARKGKPKTIKFIHYCEKVLVWTRETFKVDIQ